MTKFSKISVLGLGYIGLPTAAIFASRKVEVIGVDVNQAVIDTINQGQIHIVEPDLDIAVHAAVSQGYLRATNIPEPAEAFLIAVPTPLGDHNREPDLSYVEAATHAIAPVLEQGNLVVLESTSPVGTTEIVAKLLAEARPDLTFPQNHGNEADIKIAHCPERVLPGKVIHELVSNDRLIGGMSQHCSEMAVSLYQTFVHGNCVVTNARTAEMAKLTENSYRDVNIAIANELSIICDKLDIDVWELIELANRHPRVNILQPGPGVGGHCIAVDPWFIVSGSKEEARLIRTAREVNDSKPKWVLNKVENEVAKLISQRSGVSAKDIKIGLYGLAFKADIDDLRESPALHIAYQLASIYPGQIIAVEPNITELPNLASELQLGGLEETIRSADLHVLLVDHKEFKSMQPSNGIVVDTRGIW